MRRREFIAFVGGATMWPLAARAQRRTMPAMGLLSLNSREGMADLVAALHRGLNEAGYVEGLNLAIEYRWAGSKRDQLPALAADLVHREVAVFFASNVDAARAAKAATASIPIVFAIANDPVQFGLVASLNRPGGNVTGVTYLTAALGEKRLGLLHELVPAASSVGVLVNPNNANASVNLSHVEAAARNLGLQSHVVNASSQADLDGAFAAVAQKRAEVLLVLNDPLFRARRDQLIALGARQAIPAMFVDRDYARAGGLISYGASVADAYRQAGVYVGRILKGEAPADLPVLQPVKFELVINLKTAKVLGLEVPASLLALADEVIE
jgi:putative ABC transport system substrate-binding protein